jgi:hypothetical protein
MAKHTHTFTEPAFWLAYTDPQQLIDNPRNNYGYSIKGEVSTGQQYLEIFESEPEMAAYIDLQVNITGWYYECVNRIPYPPNPNKWECPEEE